MEARAPAVVAVVVTTGPAPGLEAALTTLTGQDYEELSVLVVANGGQDDVTARVAAVDPNAFVKVLEENRGFAAACNEAVIGVTGAAFFLFCHDDVLFFEGAVRQLVEASFRTNAGITSPKVVAYEDPFILRHVGQVADRFGVVRERVEEGEIDHGQQDLERDVFVAPGGVTLVRADLFETLHGFDPLIPAIGEDLDLCWRAQVAGARVFVAPSAVVAHRETLATGERVLSARGTRRSTYRDLQRRHQLATVLTCWGPLGLLQVVPVLILLDVAEASLAVLGRDLSRVRSIAGAWRWVWRNRKSLRQRRRELNRIRVIKDSDIIKLQVGGANRLRTFFTTLIQDGLDRARGILPELVDEDDSDGLDHGIGFDEGFGADDSEYELEPIELHGVRHRVSQFLNGARSQMAVLFGAALLWLYGARQLFTTPLPLIGRLAPLDSWWSTWRHFFASWTPNGVGTGAPGMPGYGVLGFAGTFVFGRMGVLPRVALIFAIPFGALGVWRLLRGVVSNRARVVAAVGFLAVPVGANLVARGRIDTLVVAAVLPYALRRLLVIVRVPGFRDVDFAAPTHFGSIQWRNTRAGQIAGLTLQVALMTAMQSASLVVVELVLIGLVLAAAILGRSTLTLERPVALAFRLALGVAVLLAPLTIGAAFSGIRALDLFGQRTGGWDAFGLTSLVRGGNGPFGFGWGAWLLPAVAISAVLLARATRRTHAVMIAVIAALAVLTAALGQHGFLGRFAPDVDTLLVLVGLCTAVLLAVTITAIENDLAASSFSWRQPFAALLVGGLLVAVLPFAALSASGRYSLPVTGTPESLGALAPTTLGGYRVLWLGDPNALPEPGWSVVPGLSAATSTSGLPDGSQLFAPPSPGAFSVVANDVARAMSGNTVHLGQLLAPAGITAIVVMTRDAPFVQGLQTPRGEPVPRTLLTALRRQVDLSQTLSSSGAVTFSNSSFHGIVAERAAPLGERESAGSPDAVLGWQPVLDFGFRIGTVGTGTVVSGLAPASAFQLKINGHAIARQRAFEWASQYSVNSGTASLTLHQFPFNGILAGATLLIWAVALLGFGALDALRVLGRRWRRSSADTVDGDSDEVAS